MNRSGYFFAFLLLYNQGLHASSDGLVEALEFCTHSFADENWRGYSINGNRVGYDETIWFSGSEYTSRYYKVDLDLVTQLQFYTRVHGRWSVYVYCEDDCLEVETISSVNNKHETDVDSAGVIAVCGSEASAENLFNVLTNKLGFSVE